MPHLEELVLTGQSLNYRENLAPLPMHQIRRVALTHSFPLALVEDHASIEWVYQVENWGKIEMTRRDDGGILDVWYRNHSVTPDFRESSSTKNYVRSFPLPVKRVILRDPDGTRTPSRSNGLHRSGVRWRPERQLAVI